MQDDIAEFIAWLENPGDSAPAPEPVANADPFQARVPAAHPKPTQVDVDRWMENYDPEWSWQHDTASEAQLYYLTCWTASGCNSRTPTACCRAPFDRRMRSAACAVT